MNPILQVFILCLPFLIEGGIEAWFEKKKGISVGHAWTMWARAGLMLAIGVAFDYYDVALWWQATLLQVALHFAFFMYYYNGLTGRVWSYLRDGGIDAVLKAYTEPHILVFMQGWALACSWIIYFDLESTIFAGLANLFK